MEALIADMDAKGISGWGAPPGFATAGLTLKSSWLHSVQKKADWDATCSEVYPMHSG